MEVKKCSWLLVDPVFKLGAFGARDFGPFAYTRLHRGQLMGKKNKQNSILSFLVVVVQSLSHVRFFMNPWTAAHQASLSFTIFWSLIKHMFIESVMPSNPLIFCHPLLLPSIFSSMSVFSNELALCIRWPKYWSFSFSISLSNEY